MDNYSYIKVGQLFWIIQDIVNSASGNTVTVSIRRLSDGYTWNFTTTAFASGANSGNMTFITGSLWKQSFTPPTEDTYIVTITNSTLGTEFVQVLKAVGAVAQAGVTGTELTTLANLREYLKKDTADTTDDTLLQNIITRVSAEIEKRCNRSFHAATFTEYQKGNGTNRTYLKNWPINSVTSIHIDDDREWTADMAVDAADIIISNQNPGMIILDSGETFRKTVDQIENVRIIYNAGYSTIPTDLEQACIEICCVRYIKSGGMINSVIKDTIDPDDVEKKAWELIENYYRAIPL